MSNHSSGSNGSGSGGTGGSNINTVTYSLSKGREATVRPGSASTIDSYSSAMPFSSDEASPTLRKVALPALGSSSNGSNNRISTKAGAKDAFEEMLASGETWVKSGTAEVARPSQDSKRDMGHQNGHDSPLVKRIELRRERNDTVVEQCEDDGFLEGEASSDGQAGHQTPRLGPLNAPASPSKMAARPPKSTDRSPAMASTSRPIHPLLAAQEAEREGRAKGPSSTTLYEQNRSPTELKAGIPSAPSLTVLTSASPATLPQTVSSNASPLKGRSRSKAAAVSPSPTSFSNSSQTTFTAFPRQSDGLNQEVPQLEMEAGSPDSNATVGNSLKERLKKTSGFLKRLGGGSSAEKGRTLNVPRTPKVVRKSSQSSFASDGGASLAPSTKSAPGEYQSRWDNEEAVPVPSIPSKYKGKLKSPSKQSTEGKENIFQDARGLPTSESVQREMVSPAKKRHTRANSSGGGSADSASTDMRHALLAWEHEMDATLKQSGQDLESKTKIDKPSPNWAPSPQLPEYNLNRKSSFMDEEHEVGESTEMLVDSVDHNLFLRNPAQNKGKRQEAGGTPSSRTYESHYLSPQPAQRSASLGIGLPSSVSPQNSLIHSDPISSTPTFSSHPHHDPTEDAQRSRRTRDDNTSYASAMSYETAIDRPSFFLRQGAADNEEKTQSGGLGFTTNSSLGANVAGHAQEGQQGDTSSDLVEDMDPEKSIRLITNQSIDTDQGDTVWSSPPASNGLDALSITSPVLEPSKHAKDRTITAADVPSSAMSLSRDLATPSGVEQPGDRDSLARDFAAKCWNEDESFKKKEKVAEWLGGTGPVKQLARRHYMDYYDFAGLRLDAAFRKLCDKLFLRAETQQVDRILSAFSQRYYDCNPQWKATLLNPDVVHALVFSLVLLNTDLHVADIQDRMTRNQFVRNTRTAILESSDTSAPQAWSNSLSSHNDGSTSRSSLSASVDAPPSDSVAPLASLGSSGATRLAPSRTVSNDCVSTAESEGGRGAGSSQPNRLLFNKAWEVEMEGVLKEIYAAIKNDQIRLPIGDSTGLTAPYQRKTARAGSDRVNALKRGSIRGIQGLLGSNNLNFRSDENLSLSRTSISSTHRSYSDFQPLSTPSTSMASATSHAYPSASTPLTLGFANTLSQSIIKEANDEDDSRSMDSANDDFTDDELALMGPPWAKEGMLTRKHYWEAPLKRAKDKNWTDCFVVVQKGLLSMFRFGTASSSTAQSSGLGGGNWLSNATCIGEFSLAHTLANSLPPPGYNRARPHVFALTLANGSVYFFQTGHEELVQEWVSTCNYWAARQSREPLGGGVSNMEYGWNRVMPGESGHQDDEETSSLRSEAIHQRSDLYKSMNSSDVRSIRSGKSGRSLRIRSSSKAIFPSRQSNGPDISSINGNNLSSPVPAPSSVRGSSTFYGSERPLYINEWRTPAPPTVSSTLNEEDQLEACKRHRARVEVELTEHNALRQPMIDYFESLGGANQGGATLTKALANFDRKASYLLSDLTKFTLYTATLTSANRLKLEKRDARQLNRMMLKADEELSRVKEEEEGPPITT